MREMSTLTLVVLLSSALPAAAQTAAPDAVSSQEIEKLKRQIYQETRSNVEALFDAHGENGGLNDELSFWRYGAKLNLRLKGDSSLYGSVLRTSYSTDGDVLQTWATRVGGGFRGKVGKASEAQLELGFTHFGTDANTVDGLASFSTKPAENAHIFVTASRVNVEESFLSAAGIRPVEGPFAGEQVGNVMENRLAVGGDYRLPHRFDAYAEASLGTRAGNNVDSNFFKRAGGGLGWSAVARDEEQPLSLVRLSLAVDYFGFSDDRLGYGGASLLDDRGQPVPIDELGSDGISPEPAEGNPGVGGYFSPERFVSGIVRVDLKGGARTAFEYRVSAFVGTQSYTGSDSRLAAGFNGSIVIRLSDRISVPVTAVWDDYGPFRQQSLFARLLVRF